MAEKPNVTRIKAQDDASVAKSKAKKASSKALETVKPSKKAPRASKNENNVFRRMGAYFVGAWVELRQVRWPSRRATWSLTLAVIAFSLLVTMLILALDALFQYIFQLVIT